MRKIDKPLFISVGIIVFLYTIKYILTGKLIPCIFHELTNLYCPGCGVTRMVLSLLKLDIYQAFRYNPYIFSLMILFLSYQALKLITNHFSTIKITLNNYIYIGLLITTIAFGILRNLPYFSYLIPTIVT